MAEQIAVLGIEARTKGLSEAVRDLDNLESAGARAERATDGLSNQLSTLRNVLISVGAAATVREIINAADSWGQYASRIRMATDSVEEYEYAQSRMLESANRTFRSIEETRESFIQMSPILRDLGLTLGESVDALDTFSGLLVVNAANAERGARAQAAFSKALQTGRVDSEGWQSILASIPTVVDLIAESTGRTASEIRQLGITGKLAVDDLVTSLVQGNEQILRQVDEMPTTVADALQRLTNQAKEYVGVGNEARGTTESLVSALNLVADNFELIAGAATVAGAAILGRYLGPMVASAAATIRQTLAKRAALKAEIDLASAIRATALIEAKAATTTAQRTVALNVAANAEQRLAVAQAGSLTVATAARGALALLGGHIGAVTLALTAGAAAWSIWGSKAKEATTVNTAAAELRVREIEAEMRELEQRINRTNSEGARQNWIARIGRLNEEARGLRQALRELTGGVNESERANNRLSAYLRERRSVAEQMQDDLSNEKEAFKAATRGVKEGSAEYTQALEAYYRKVEEIRSRYEKKGAAAPEDETQRYVDALRQQLRATEQLTAAETVLRDVQDGRIKLEGQNTLQSVLNIARQIDAATALNRAREQGKALTESMRTPIEVLYAEERRLDDLMKAGVISRETYSRALEKARDAYYQTTEAAKTAREEEERLRGMLDATPSAQLERTRADMILLRDAFLSGADGIETVEQYIEAVQTRLGMLPEEIKTVGDAMDEFAIQAARSIQSTLADALYSIGDDSDDMAKRFGEAVKRMVADAVAADLGRRLFGDMGSTGNVGGWVGSALGWLGGLMSFDGGGYTGSGPRSGGLDGKGGRLALIHPQETIIDHTSPVPSFMGGGNSYNVTVHVPPGSPMETRRAAAAGAREALSLMERSNRFR